MIGDPKRRRHFNKKLAAFECCNRKNAYAGEDAKYNSHIRADFLDVIIDRAVIVIQGMPVSRSVSMHMWGDMAIRGAFAMGVLERKSMVIVTGVASGGL